MTRSRLFIVWFVVFAAFWITLVATFSLWQTVAEHWPIALAMATGSYFAGSTPVAGGTVGFPVLVLLLDEPATIGRDFSLAIQSVGMISATILIFARRLPLDRGLLKWTLVGALAGAPLGAAFIAPNVNDLTVKLLFAVTWASFGVVHLTKLRAIVRAQGATRTSTRLDREIGILLGLVGGVAASIVGVGIDMMLYVVLVLLYRADLKIAILTSVVAMAITSVIGLVSHLALGQVNPEVFGHWIAAAPVVLLGAPAGVWAVSRISRTPTLLIVSTLCVGQFVWMCVELRVWGPTLVWAIVGVLVFIAAFQLLYVAGERIACESGSMPEMKSALAVQASQPPLIRSQSGASSATPAHLMDKAQLEQEPHAPAD